MSKSTGLAGIVLGVILLAGVASAGGYRVTAGSGDDEVPVVVVWGTPHEMGRAFGELMRDEIQAFVPQALAGFQQSEPEQYNDAELDAAWEAIAPHTHARIEEEWRGLAEGSGVDFETIRRIHMIPVVSPYACSGAALWGSATRDDALFQFRNLDYTMHAGLQDYPAVVIYLPDEGHAHVNVTFAGVTGVNTGMNAQGIALTEMGDSPPHEYPYDLDGAHFTFLFRDLLYDAGDLEEALELFQNAQHIKRYHYIIGDGKTQRGVKIRAHAPDLEIWTDNDPEDSAAPNVVEDVVYHCEGRDPIGFAHIQRYHGRYDADAVIQLSKSVGIPGGNLLNAVYDATNLDLWVAYAHGMESAYRRPYVHIPMQEHLDPGIIPEGATVVD